MSAFNLLFSNDTAGVHAPSWYEAITPAFDGLPRLEGETDCDVCIIGGGLTGVSAGLHLSKAGYNVKLLEAHRIGWGASGRNGGQVGSGQRQDQDYLEKHYGYERARQYWQLAQEAKSLIKKLIKDYQINCQPIDGIIHADHKQSYVDESRSYAEKLQQDYHYDSIRFVDKNELRSLVRSNRYFGGTVDEGAFHINPLAFNLGLAKAAIKHGCKLYENSVVTSVEEGSRPVIHTEQGSVRARFLIYACNGYLGKLQKKIAEHVLPINNFIIVTKPLDDHQRSSILPSAAAVADTKFVVNYFRITHDNRLLFGGGENYGYRFPDDIKAFVKKPMLEIFPQAKDLTIEYGWGGTLAVTLNRLPLFQKIAGNILTCSGYSGHGVALATLGGKLASEVIDGQAARFDLMSELDTPRFPGGTLFRYPMLVAAMTWYSLRDKL